MIKTFLAVFLFFFVLCGDAGKAVAKENDALQEYKKIVQNIKDNPKQAIEELKKIKDVNDSAAVEYLILVSIYDVKQKNTSDFKETATRLHEKIVPKYETVVAENSFYSGYQSEYLSRVKDDYMKCYQSLPCLIEIGGYVFSKFFDIWGNRSGDALHVPWSVIVPCPTAQKLHLTAIMDEAWGGHGAEAISLSNCESYPEFDFPDGVNEYKNFINGELEIRTKGSIRFVYYALHRYQDMLARYDPDFELKEQEEEYLKNVMQALPLESWAMESYPNYKEFERIINHGIGFEKAVEKLTGHYIRVFNAEPEKARRYARYVMTPWAGKSDPVDKDTLRYKILSGVPAEEIKTWIENQKQQGEAFKEPATPHVPDPVLMTSIHRPDVLKVLLEFCSGKKCPDGFHVNGKNVFGKTALMYAAQHGFTDSVKILLDAGADINAQTDEGTKYDGYCWAETCIVNGKRTALMYAVAEGHLDLAKYLIKRGADISVKDSQGMDVHDYLSGKAPLLGNFKPSPMETEAWDGTLLQYYKERKHENKNLTPEQAKEFEAFLKKYEKTESGDK
ncbi:MAG: ankyrin repeat domain-containing protein [Alphaproteobacteria bacterium]|nr:ankyrin repeat domain-containing protein [Alphaproteobacteria bacterium]